MSFKLKAILEETGKTLELLSEPSWIGRTLAEILADHGVSLNMRCAGKGLCDSCRIELLHGELTNLLNASTATAEPGSPIFVKSCLYGFTAETEDVSIRIPSRSTLSRSHVVVADFHPDIAEDIMASQRKKAKRSQKQAARTPLGAAVDVGTTTVALTLVDLESGESTGKSAALNQQAKFGDNVISRIKLCAENQAMVGTLQRAINDETILPLLHEALHRAGRSEAALRSFVIAGNTTMLHLVAGVDPSPLGVLPFAPAFLGHTMLSSGTIKAGVGGGFETHLLPGISAYVGADISAGIYATKMLKDQKTSLLIDIGTNGEIVLSHRGAAFACATAAGPAFEGVGLVSGTRAIPGAVCHIGMRSSPFEIDYEVIGEEGTPVGVCGSAYIDFLASAKRIGLAGDFGRLTDDPAFQSHLTTVPDQHVRAVRIADTVLVSEADISGLLQAKAAVAAGIQILMKRAGVQAGDIDTVYLAGGFGLNINVDKAVDCGLLPGFLPSQIKAIGNSSLAGAYLALIDEDAIPEMERYRQEIEVVELNLDPDFENLYIDNMML